MQLQGITQDKQFTTIGPQLYDNVDNKHFHEHYRFIIIISRSRIKSKAMQVDFWFLTLLTDLESCCQHIYHLPYDTWKIAYRITITRKELWRSYRYGA